jgi:hydrogenase expression/formation protein HypD
MKYIDEYRNPELIARLVNQITGLSARLACPGGQPVTFMEVCGTHTMSIARHGLKKLLPADKIRLISGPGCPVCVSPKTYIDKIIKYALGGNALTDDIVIVTFGDMYRVPGSNGVSLEKLNTGDKKVDVRVVYSPIESIKIAETEPHKKIVFAGVGFETTTPVVAATVSEAANRGLTNWFLLSGHKVIPPAMKLLLDTKEVNVTGFICPGHVSTIIGTEPYEFISRDYKIPCVVTGFEPVDILEGILMLVKQSVDKTASVQVQYKRLVKPEGNKTAVDLMYKIFSLADSDWRGIGVIPLSGLRLNPEYAKFDIEQQLPVDIESSGREEDKSCICGGILRGLQTPLQCKLFRKVCTPENPVGGCMVSSEGTCAAYYKYGE